MVCMVAWLLTGCASGGPAPVSDRTSAGSPAPVSTRTSAQASAGAGYHVVQRGDTLYSIAWRYGRDWRDLAARNRIPEPYVIKPGDRLYLEGTAPRAVATARPQSSAGSRQQPAAAPRPAPTRAPPSVPAAAELKWTWPVDGEVVRAFSAGGPRPNQGLDMRAREGSALQASAAGEVVYAGSGLRGFGQLVIVKHDEHWLSAYAHNSPTLVREGQRVSLGDRLAVLDGSSERSRVVHFEIRRQGSPVDPVSILPRR